MGSNIRIPTGVAEWDTVPELVAARAAANPDVSMIEIDGRPITYGELDRQSSVMAANLYRLGVRKGDRVGSYQHNSVEMLILWIGTNKLGAVWVPMNAGLSGQDLRYTVDNASLKLLVVGAELADCLPVIGDLDSKPPLIIAGGNEDTFSDLLSPCPSAPHVALSAADPAVIIYTGGTTGMPKGAVLPQFAFIAAGYRYVQAFSTRPDDRHYSILTMFHVGGLMLGLLGPMVANIPTFLDRRFSVKNFWKRIRETRATIADPLGTMISLLLREPKGPGDRDHTVRITLAAMAQLPAGTRERYTARFGIETVNVYSLTECGGILIINNPPGSPVPGANGKGWGWAEVAVLDENDIPLPSGQSGQIALRPSVTNIFMCGYHNNPQRTLECMSNLWLHTGDLGYLDENGFLFLTGRQVHWIRRRGENISAYEVESVISQYPGVREVIAVGVPSEMGEEEVKVFIIPDGQLDPADIVKWCAGQITYFKIPRFIEFLPDLPRSVAKMEVERQKLKDLPNDRAWDREAQPGAVRAPIAN